MKLYVDTNGKQVTVSREAVEKTEQNGRQRQERGTGRLMWSVASGIRCKSAGVVPGFMIRLGDGADSFGAAGGGAGGDGVWPQLGGWFEQ